MTTTRTPTLPAHDFLTLPQVAATLQISVLTTRNLAARADDPLPTVRVGRQLRVAATALEAWLSRQR